MSTLTAWVRNHPNLTFWFVLAAGMVAIMLFEARAVGLTASQWFWLIVVTIGVAGLCVLIINWGDDDDDAADAGAQ